MICPICKEEYGEGYLVCPECQVPLTDSISEVPLEEADGMESSELVEVTEFYNPDEVVAVKSLLDNAGIKYLIKNEFSKGTKMRSPAVLMVAVEDVEEVMELLDAFESDAGFDE